MTATTDHNAILAKRGILTEAHLAGWQPYTSDGRPGWSFPVFNAVGEPYRKKKWKAADDNKPKNRWLPGKPERAKYYFIPGTFSEIQARFGNCYLAGGEPDVLAYRAAGIKNVICWLDGEGSPPDTLADDLSHMGVTLLLYAPDRDLVGMQSAHKVANALDGTSIEVIFYQLPGDVGTGYDINDLWIDAQFKPEEFKIRLAGSPLLDLVDAHLYAQQTGPKKPHATENVSGMVKTWRDQWQQLIVTALGTPAVTENARARWHCPLPSHEDKHPSFRIATEKNPDLPWPMCSCGIQDNPRAWDVVAEALNVQTWQDYKAEKALSEGFKPTTPGNRPKLSAAPNSSPQLPNGKVKWVDSHDLYLNLKDELTSGRLSDIQPVICPLSVLHQFGGFARFMRRGKLTAITGISGGGKTLLSKTMMIKLMQLGYDVVWWGPEWSPEEYAEQDLQRQENGLTLEQLDMWRVWRFFEQKGPEVVKEMSAKYDLARPSEAAIRRAVAATDELISWPGRMYIIPDQDAPIRKVIEIARDICSIKRQEGRDVAAFVWDYVQLTNMPGSHTWDWAERVTQIIKNAVNVRDMNLCGFVSAQSRKGDSEAARSGEKLTQGSAQGLSDAKFNLYLTLTPEFEEDKITMKDTAWLSLVKNSSGRRGSIKVYTDFAHLAVLDKQVQTLTQVMNERLEGGEQNKPLDLEGF
ncbi:MAG: toprim domain-containing protein [Dehalococcoidia bacterium]|jgi:hypothetical protein